MNDYDPIIRKILENKETPRIGEGDDPQKKLEERNRKKELLQKKLSDHKEIQKNRESIKDLIQRAEDLTHQRPKDI